MTPADMTVDRVGEMSDAHADSFQAVRPRLLGIAHRVLGSAAEADDVVQDTWTRWQGADRSTVRDAAAFLATATTRLAINVAQSARARRETYIGPWLPEPVDPGADPVLDAERREALELAVLILFERLSPTERAAYVLREAFDYPHRQIAQVLGLTEANARQLVTRARGHLSSQRRNPFSASEQREFVEAFVAAAQSGDLAVLEQLLATERERASTLPIGVAA
jgi:RNA polymerase sigma-70 factor, ECF subfamily